MLSCTEIFYRVERRSKMRMVEKDITVSKLEILVDGLFQEKWHERGLCGQFERG